jgi:phosphatidylserine decarboxylase
MAREGLPYVIVPLLIALILFLAGIWLVALIFLGTAGFMAFFFRDPQRTVPSDPGVVVAPADGRVTRVEPLDPRNPASPTVVSIFLSPLDVHINRAPIAGKISNMTYKRGRFMIATRNEASLVNEQNSLTIEGEKITLVCKQIAGVLARRIVCWKHTGDEMALGERFGMIKFSSRTDLILPPDVEIAVNLGARVKGGVTIVGRIR